MTEKFIPIVGYEGLYEVSNYGTIRYCAKTKGTNYSCKIQSGIKKVMDNGVGYLATSLTRDGIKKTVYVHREVAKAFIPNPNSYKEVNHIDGNKLNNHIDNLEWCTRLENEQHAWAAGLKHSGEKHFASRGIEQLDNSGKVIAIYVNGSDIESKTEFDRSVVQRCCRGVIKQAYGFKWRYAS